MEKDESYIITRILAGKTEEYAYFLDTYGQPVFSLIVRMVNSEEDAEELTQDTFMKAFEHLSSFNGIGRANRKTATGINQANSRRTGTGHFVL